jgi:hypothetical protein
MSAVSLNVLFPGVWCVLECGESLNAMSPGVWHVPEAVFVECGDFLVGVCSYARCVLECRVFSGAMCLLVPSLSTVSP